MLTEMMELATLTLIFNCILTSHGMSRDFFGRDSENPNDCTTVQEQLNICVEDLADLRASGQCREPRIVRERSPCETYMKRLLNLLLSSVSLKNRHLIDDEKVTVTIPLTFTSESLNILKSFSSDIPHDFSWIQLDESFVTLFGKASSAKITQNTEEYPKSRDDASYAGSVPTNPIVIIFGVVGILLGVILYLIVTDQSLVRTFFVGVAIIFCLSLGWTWHLEVRKETDRGLMTLRKSTVVPDHCFQSDDRIWSQFVETITKNKEEQCRKYHEALMYEPWTRVSFVKVFTLTVSGLFLESLPLLGKTLGQMIYNMNSELGIISSFIGGLTTSLILPPLLVVSLVFFFSSSLSSLFTLRSSRSQTPEQPTHQNSSSPSLPHSKPDPLNLDSLSYRPLGDHRDIHKPAKKRVHKFKKGQKTNSPPAITSRDS